MASIDNVSIINISPTVHHSYHINDVLNKRGFESAHIAFWLLKDLAWIRVWDHRIMGAIGLVATTWGFIIFCWDVLDIFKPKNKDKLVRYEIFKECFTSLGCTIWLAGNSWWAVGETWDLANTAGYNEVYEQYTGQAIWVLGTAFFILIPFWVCNFIVEMFGLSKTAYRQRLNRMTAHYLMTGKPVPFDLVKEMSEMAHLEERTSSECTSGVALPQEEFCINVEDSFKNYVAQMDICGMPYKTPGLIGIPSGMPHVVTGKVKDKKAFACQMQGIISYRDYENIIIGFWLCKDLVWLFEDPMWAQIIWYVPAFCVAYVSCDMFATLVRYRKSCNILLIEIIHSFALVLWVLCNLLWCWGEMYMDHEVPGLDYSDPLAASAYIIPGFFTPYADLPPGPWFLRFIAAWILLIAIVALLLAYVSIIIIDLNTFREVRRVKKNHSTIQN